MGDDGEYSWISAMFYFKAEGEGLPKQCSGFLHIIPLTDEQDSGWKICVIRTMLENFMGHGNVDTLAPALSNGHVNGHESFNGNHGEASDALDAVVIGAGCSGLSTAGRLKALGLSCLLLEKNARIGDSWANRYYSAKLHTPREYSHLPFDRQFFADDGELLGREKLGIAYEGWADRFGLNYWTNAVARDAKWDGAAQIWAVKVDVDGREEMVVTRHVVLALGIGGQGPSMPDLPGRDSFKGTVLHSADYKDCAGWQGKKGVVIGTANTAHDVANDMLQAGLSSVTMVQRGHTFVVPGECLVERYSKIYNQDLPTEIGDRISLTGPMGISGTITNMVHHKRINEKKELYDGLEEAGFKLQRYGDLNSCLYEKFGGHYIDVGVSEKIAKGDIKMKSDAKTERYTENGLLFDDGSHLDADVIVFSTGFNHNYRKLASQIVGSEIADQTDDYWGVNNEGEIRGAWIPSGHPNLWYAGGTLGQARFMTRFIALQIKAKMLGMPLRRYEN